jgi:kynurenine formamidase
VRKLPKVKCPYFLSKTNGHKLYINCSTEKYINSNSLRKEFEFKEVRRVCYETNCCNDYKHCKNFVKLLMTGRHDKAAIISIEAAEYMHDNGINTIVTDGKYVQVEKI